MLAAGLDEVHDRHPTAYHWSDLDVLKTGVLPRLEETDVVLAKASGSTGLIDSGPVLRKHG